MENGGPGPSVSLTFAPVGFPHPQSPISRFTVANAPLQVEEPCVSISAFFIEGIAEAADGPVLVWHRQGSRETSFTIDPRVDTLRARPVITFRTGDLSLLRQSTATFHVEIEATIGSDRSTQPRDYLVLGIGMGPDGAHATYAFEASGGWSGGGPYVQGNKGWEWWFYALEDRKSHCRRPAH
jgi:hypothetical protein